MFVLLPELNRRPRYRRQTVPRAKMASSRVRVFGGTGNSKAHCFGTMTIADPILASSLHAIGVRHQGVPGGAGKRRRARRARSRASAGLTRSIHCLGWSEHARDAALCRYISASARARSDFNVSPSRDSASPMEASTLSFIGPDFPCTV